jgi:hypothetical protein
MSQKFKTAVGLINLTQTQINGLTGMAAGDTVFNTTSGKANVYNGAAWAELGGGGHVIQEEGSSLAQRSKLNFIGSGVTASDDSGNDATLVTIAAGGHIVQDEGTPLTARANLNFVGNAVAASDDSGNAATKITVNSTGLYREFYVAGTAKNNYTGSLTVIDLLAAYTADGKTMRLFINGQLQTPVTNYAETDADTITMADSLNVGDDIQVEWTVAGTSILQATPGTEVREEYVAGTPSGNYTGSLTLFNLVAAYTLGNINLKVYVNGQLQRPNGAGYTETSTTAVTFASVLTAGDKVVFTWTQGTQALVSYTPATQVIETYVVGTAKNNYTGSLSQFDLSNAFTPGGANLQVSVDGTEMTLGDDYAETTNQRIDFSPALETGQHVSLRWIQQVGFVGSQQEQYSKFTATSGQQVFNPGFTYALGGTSLLVFVGGLKQVINVDYLETSNSQITFLAGVRLGLIVEFYSKNRAPNADADTVDGYHGAYLAGLATNATEIAMLFGG